MKFKAPPIDEKWEMKIKVIASIIQIFNKDNKEMTFMNHLNCCSIAKHDANIILNIHQEIFVQSNALLNI